MSKLAPSLLAAMPLLFALHGAPAHALSARTLVSAAIGNDANDCTSSVTPCRSFQAAHDRTADQGEVVVLDPGGYGALTITKSISVSSDAGEASILVSGGNTGITINAAAGAGYVNLRGLTVQGIEGGASTGLRFNTGVSLTITNCVIRNHTGNGIEFFSQGPASNLSVTDSLVSDNGGSGIAVNAFFFTTRMNVALSRVTLVSNSKDGLAVIANTNGSGRISASVADSLASGNGGAGFHNFGDGEGVASIVVQRSIASNNHIGLLVEGGGFIGVASFIRVGESTVSGNDVSWQGLVVSYGDNAINGNFDNDPAPRLISKK